MREESASGWDLQERQKTRQQMRFSGSDEADFHWVLTQTLNESQGRFYSQVMKYSPHVEWIIYPVLLTFTQALLQCFVSLSIHCHNRTRNEMQLITCWHGRYVTNSVVRDRWKKFFKTRSNLSRMMMTYSDMSACVLDMFQMKAHCFQTKAHSAFHPLLLEINTNVLILMDFGCFIFLIDCAINGFPRQWTHETPLPTKLLSLSLPSVSHHSELRSPLPSFFHSSVLLTGGSVQVPSI